MVDFLLKFGIDVKIKQTTNDVSMNYCLNTCKELGYTMKPENPRYRYIASTDDFAAHVDCVDGMSRQLNCHCRTGTGKCKSYIRRFDQWTVY